MKTYGIPILAIASLLAVGCSEESGSLQNNELHAITLSRGGEEVVKVNNNFAARLIDGVDNQVDNIVLSPLSLYQYLSMVTNGANGLTKEELEGVIGVDGLNIDDINSLNYELISSLRSVDKKTTFTASNSFWYVNDVDILPRYKSVMQDYYASEVKIMDTLSDNDARRSINEWCNDKTEGVIENFLEFNLEETVKYASYNTVYFKSEWSTPFKNDGIGTFMNADGSTSTADYMIGHVGVRYFENDNLQYAEIPYGNGAYVFSIILPKESASFSILTDMDKIQVKPRIIDVKMPKFKLNSKTQMNEVLRSMGLEHVFCDDADFSNICDYNQPLVVLHAVGIEVDEKGTVAAAVTGDGLVYSTQPIFMNVNRPFNFFIKETSTSTILFIGKINSL